jgi:hypothetical protein
VAIALGGRRLTEGSAIVRPDQGKQKVHSEKEPIVKKSIMPAAKSVLIAAVLATVVWVSAGSLTPPAGPVSPTMKNLLDVEPRTAIRNDFVNITPIVISSPGSYYLAEDILAIFSQHGIEITASNVTLDLNGFTIYGNVEVGSLDGIHVTGSRTNITIRNGVVRDFFNDGLDLGTANNSLVEDVRATNNGFRGISIGANGGVHRCATIGPAGDIGIFTGANSIVSHSVASGGFHGIFVGAASVVSDCTAKDNTNSGIAASSSTVEHCAVTGNQTGISITSGGKVVDCTASSNTSDGISASGGYVFGNQCSNNGAAGISVNAQNTRVDSNNVTSNARGIDVNVSNNVIVRNSANANSVTDYDIAGGNDVGPIGTAAASTSPWANISY